MRPMTILSTAHQARMVDPDDYLMQRPKVAKNKRRKSVRVSCPWQAIDYKENMGSVDLAN